MVTYKNKKTGQLMGCTRKDWDKLKSHFIGGRYELIEDTTPRKPDTPPEAIVQPVTIEK